MAVDKEMLFMDLYLKVQSRLYGFVLSLVANVHDADDIIQDTVFLMWSRFDEYQPGTDFAAWAFTVARYQIMTYYNKKKTNRRHFSQKVFDVISSTFESITQSEDGIKEDLQQCLKKLNNEDRQLLRLRYEIGETLQSIANRLNRNINFIYGKLNRAHVVLLKCLTRIVSED